MVCENKTEIICDDIKLQNTETSIKWTVCSELFPQTNAREHRFFLSCP